MKFYCFPKNQKRCSVYSSYNVIKTRLFSNFVLQTSPKNSFFFKIRKTYFGHLLASISTINIEIPNSDAEYVGIKKPNKLILIEIENGTPKWVWKSENDRPLKKEPFLGYQIIAEFSLNEFIAQEKIIKKALSEHWQNLNKSIYNLHGDFTHFNILYDENETIHLIDKQQTDNSKLFDFFYFYAYLKHSINRDLSITQKEKARIILLIELWLKEICKYSNRELFEKDFNNIKISDSCRVTIDYPSKYLDEFYKIFYNES